MLLEENVKRILEGCNHAFLATINKDGSPQVTPTWVDTDGENVLINTALGRKKTQNMTRDPRVALSAIDREHPVTHVAIQGTVIRQITGPEAYAHAEKLAMKYKGRNRDQTFPTHHQERVLVVIQPTKVHYFSR